jgi:hypothetical protein
MFIEAKNVSECSVWEWNIPVPLAAMIRYRMEITPGCLVLGWNIALNQCWGSGSGIKEPTPES